MCCNNPYGLLRRAQLLLLFLSLCCIGHSDAATLFTTDDCAQINNTSNSCSCKYNQYDIAVITCNNASNTTSNITTNTSAAQIRIEINEMDEVTLICDNINTNSTLHSLYARLPLLGALRSTKLLIVHDCLPLAPALARLQLLPTVYVYVAFVASHIHTLTAAHFGTALQHISDLELDSEQQSQQRHWQLAPDLFAHMPMLYQLHIKLGFTQLPATIFEPLPRLNTLILAGNLSALPRDALRHARSLRTFGLTKQQLQPLSADEFREMPVLTRLTLNYNGISMLPAEIFWPLKLLRWLMLMRNELSVLPETLLWQQTQLQRLDLSLNRLETLPAQLFANTTALWQLSLQKNRLRYIDATVFAPLRKLGSINLDENQLITLAPQTFAQCHNLLELSLQMNKLQLYPNVSCVAFAGLQQLRQLKLAYNALTHLCPALGSSLAPQLQTIELNRNQLQRLDGKMLRGWNSSRALKSVNLAQNPWQCDCGADALLSFVKSNRQRVKDSAQVSCSDARLARLIELSYRDFCLPEMGVKTQLVIAIVFLASIALIATTSALCYYKYKLELKIWLYAHQWCLWCVSETELDRDRKYDAFLSYSHMDEEFVEQVLLPGLEEGKPPFKVCIHVRDWLAGAYIPEQIVDSVEQSRRTVIVLSQHFIESDWARMEFRTAHQCSLEEGRARIILIIYGELVNTELLDAELQAYLKMNTYLKWGDPWFWRKLRYAMPHKEQNWFHRSDSAIELEYL